MARVTYRRGRRRRRPDVPDREEETPTKPGNLKMPRSLASSFTYRRRRSLGRTTPRILLVNTVAKRDDLNLV